MQFPDKLRDFLAGRSDSLRIFKSGHATQALTAAALLRQGTSVVWVLPGEREARAARALLGLFLGEGERGASKVVFLPEYRPGVPEPREWAARWAALSRLTSRSGALAAVLSADNLLPMWPPPELAAQAELILTRHEEILSELVLEQLVLWGYRRVGMVTAPGEMSMRGDILDVFVPGFEHPARLEFFGDTLDEIRLFNAQTQRSVTDLPALTLVPAAPALLVPEIKEQGEAKLGRLKTTGQINAEALDRFTRSLEEADGFLWPGLYYQNPARLSDYLPPDAVYLLSGGATLREKMEETVWGWQEFCQKQREDKGILVRDDLLLWPEEDARRTWTSKRHLVFEELVLGVSKEGLELPERQIEAFSDLFWKPDDQKRPWTALVANLREWESQEGQTLLSFQSPRSRSRFLKLAEQEGISPRQDYAPDRRGVYALVSPLSKGMELSWAGVRILSEDVLQPGEAPTRVARSKDWKGLASYDEISQGDLLVHRDYGLSRFAGLTRLAHGEVANDYMLLLFDGEDKLYLPVDRMGMVQRYKGPEGAAPSLDSLRGARWRAAKERARKAVEKIAQELVEMYAYRRIAKGYAYSPTSELYREFEAGFSFEETPDQARAIQEVLADMERSEPMDRLVCGDVGFGKTEVALRAAFRAVADGKQVALLCPTTVLAEQHYHTFKTRMANFPVSVAMLSRFVPKAEQKTIIAAAARGAVDVLVGTHRMLSQDVHLPRLGLLVLDEEQRFGVRHKERLKELKRTIDCLTLTATPIPRTLQLSLSGIRSLSVIETPPADRKPVETALVERDDGMLRRILERELARGGQVFWVHNRVRTLDGVTAYVRSLVPEAKVGMAHGQMTAQELENAMHAFWHGETDVLVCTAIVESGLDFPNANTLIVDQAHMFGLGQLYQLRGRVGRSERQAYAYFVVPSMEAVPEDARKRLRVILDMDYLGAGFRVAMEDLRLRGAGNILGEAQSGQIAKVGLDLFLEMLEEEVRRLRGEGTSSRPETEMNFVIAAHIPESYIPDAQERLNWYKAFAAARSETEAQDLALEIKDRFGKWPVPLANFLSALELKRELVRLGASRADLYPGRVVVQWKGEDAAPETGDIVAWLQSRREWAKLLPPGKLEARLPEDRDTAQGLAWLRDELKLLAPSGAERPAP
ncbi:transcription-repair coupling factor [Desulfovibrio sp. X2]|uniref:transcription-repair coupling factor n=1 Tax=Desulfovibrio sp. X2 TaxID=941449 RepID=UPI0003589A1A|nr:transcription-repair coupling factor [Desulfovibrio sp. X2]EPR42330.1 transcription-repair coupling factor [Desulfovibrio sp. X2]